MWTRHDRTARRERESGHAGQRPRRTGRVQSRYVALRGLLEGDTICLEHPGGRLTTESGTDARYCAVLAISSVNFALRSEEEQEAIIASFSAWLNALAFDIQILVRVLPLSLEPYLRRPLRSLDALRSATAAAAATTVPDRHGSGDVNGCDNNGRGNLASAQRRASKARQDTAPGIAAPPNAERLHTRAAWIDLITDHIQFVRELARQRRLLDRHFYLVIASDSAPHARAGSGLSRRLAGMRRMLSAWHAWRLGPSATPRERESADSDRPAFLDAATRRWNQQVAARHQLDLRVTEVTRQMGRIGLSARRLRGRELIQLYHSCLTPQRAERHPLSEQVLASADAPIVARTTSASTSHSDPASPTRQDASGAEAMLGTITPADLGAVTVAAEERAVPATLPSQPAGAAPAGTTGVPDVSKRERGRRWWRRANPAEDLLLDLTETWASGPPHRIFARLDLLRELRGERVGFHSLRVALLPYTPRLLVERRRTVALCLGGEIVECRGVGEEFCRARFQLVEAIDLCDGLGIEGLQRPAHDRHGRHGAGEQVPHGAGVAHLLPLDRGEDLLDHLAVDRVGWRERHERLGAHRASVEGPEEVANQRVGRDQPAARLGDGPAQLGKAGQRLLPDLHVEAVVQEHL